MRANTILWKATRLSLLAAGTLALAGRPISPQREIACADCVDSTTCKGKLASGYIACGVINDRCTHSPFTCPSG